MIKKIKPQKTLSKSIEIQGVGLHSGEKIKLTLRGRDRIIFLESAMLKGQMD